MKLDEIKKLIERSEFEVSSKVDTLIAEGLFTFADLSNTILTARDIAKREKDELVEAVDGYKYTVIGWDRSGHRFYTAGKILADYQGHLYFFITAHKAE